MLSVCGRSSWFYADVWGVVLLMYVCVCVCVCLRLCMNVCACGGFGRWNCCIAYSRGVACEPSIVRSSVMFEGIVCRNVGANIAYASIFTVFTHYRGSSFEH